MLTETCACVHARCTLTAFVNNPLPHLLIEEVSISLILLKIKKNVHERNWLDIRDDVAN